MNSRCLTPRALTLHMHLWNHRTGERYMQGNHRLHSTNTTPTPHLQRRQQQRRRRRTPVAAGGAVVRYTFRVVAAHIASRVVFRARQAVVVVRQLQHGWQRRRPDVLHCTGAHTAIARVCIHTRYHQPSTTANHTGSHTCTAVPQLQPFSQRYRKPLLPLHTSQEKPPVPCLRSGWRCSTCKACSKSGPLGTSMPDARMHLPPPIPTHTAIHTAPHVSGHRHTPLDRCSRRHVLLTAICKSSCHDIAYQHESRVAHSE